MSSRFYISLGVALLLALAFTLPAFAGGWAVITLDELPTDVIAGQPLTIGFTVRQHGVTPLNGLYPTVTASLSQEEPLNVQAQADGKPGHYTATLIFPKEGDWHWSIQAFTMDQPMPTLHVAGEMSVAKSQPDLTMEPSALSLPMLWIVPMLAFGAGIVGLLLAYRRKSRLALGISALVISVVIVSFAASFATPLAEAQSKGSSNLPLSSSLSQVELGRQLFLAKGCITCHYNGRAASRSEYWTIEIGAPDLTNYSSHPEVLFIRLKDPAAAKSDTKMPNLELKKAEIEALIAFINSK